MFTVKLGTGKTFEATAAEEAYGAVYGGSPRLTLRLEAAPAPRSLDWYLGLLEEEGALDAVAVEAGGIERLTALGYTQVVELTQRLLPTGDKHLSMVLCKPAAQTGEEA